MICRCDQIVQVLMVNLVVQIAFDSRGVTEAGDKDEEQDQDHLSARCIFDLGFLQVV